RLFDPHKADEDQPELGQWMPDGRHILFWRNLQTPGVSINADGVPFWEVSCTDGTARRLTALKDKRVYRYILDRADFVTFAPGGRSLALAEGGERFEVT